MKRNIIEGLKIVLLIILVFVMLFMIWFYFVGYEDSDSDSYAQIVDGYIWIDTGMEGYEPNYTEDDKVYYHNNTDSLTDTYETNYGKVSVKEAIEKTEKYFNEEFPLDSIQKQSVFMVRPYKNSSGKYEFAKFKLAQCKLGLLMCLRKLKKEFKQIS